jgi:hypothetical protein
MNIKFYFIATLLFVTSACFINQDAIFAEYDFESKDLGDLRTFKLHYDYSGSISDSISRNGKYSMRFELRKGDEIGWDQDSRAELKDGLNVPLNKKIWYGISLFIPGDFPELEKNCIVIQWHGEHDEGEASRSPVLAVRVENRNLFITSRTSKQKIQNNNRGPSTTHFTLNDFPRNEWLDFVVEVIWSHTDNGSLKTWLNGDQIIRYNGPIGYNDDLGPYFKFGLYKHSGNIPLVVFHDEYRRGGSYEKVDPVLYGSNKK